MRPDFIDVEVRYQAVIFELIAFEDQERLVWVNALRPDAAPIVMFVDHRLDVTDGVAFFNIQRDYLPEDIH